MTYRGIYERSDDGSIWGRTEEFPGAFGAGDTLEEAQASVREGIRLWIEVDLDYGFGHVAAMPDELIEIVDVSELQERTPDRDVARAVLRGAGSVQPA
ncbi:MAG TPA: type II toxin-antitoxin system HicB family antitoxin [Candidatus Elarobacter sp.]|jgi:predicted RNase H-like HicB family nuclease